MLTIGMQASVACYPCPYDCSILIEMCPIVLNQNGCIRYIAGLLTGHSVKWVLILVYIPHFFFCFFFFFFISTFASLSHK